MRQPLAPCLAAATIAFATAACPAIEMFTYFGDGSRIGLPSLEVPVEAYPGIPLRSDRIRARRRGLRTAPATAARGGGTTMPRTITLRAAAAPAPVPVAPEPPAPVAPSPR